MITRKTGNILSAIEINIHLIASGVLDVEVKENSTISAKHSRKGFRILEVRFAIRCLISVCFSIERLPSLPGPNDSYINPFQPFCQPALLNLSKYKLA